MRTSIRVAWQVCGATFARLGVISVVTCVLAATLAWFYPVQRELDLVAFRMAAWDISIPIEAHPDDVDRVVSDFGTGNIFLASSWLTQLTSESGAVVNVDGYITFTADVADIDFFPPATLWMSDPAVHESWIDIDVATARGLGVHPGESVQMLVPNGSLARYQVRNVYAASLNMNRTVIADAEPVRPEFVRSAENPDPAIITIGLVRQKSEQEVRAILASSWYQERFKSGGYNVDDLQLQSRSDALSQAEQQEAGLGLIRGVGVAATLAIAALLSHESFMFASRVGKRVAVLVRLGGRPRLLSRMIVCLTAIGVGVGVMVGAILSWTILNSGVLTSAFPPTLVNTFVLLNAAGVALCAACAWVVGRVTIRGAM